MCQILMPCISCAVELHLQARLQANQRDDMQIPVAQRRPPPLLLQNIERGAPDRNAAVVTAYATGAYSYQQIASHFGVYFTTVGRFVRNAK